MTYLKRSECVPGQEYLCRYSGKRVLCMATSRYRHVDVPKKYWLGLDRTRLEFYDDVVFRYWNTVKEEFDFMPVLDDQLSAI